MRHLLSGETRAWIRHYAPVHIVGLVAVAASITVWYLTAASESRAFLEEFAGRARNQAMTVQNGIDDYWDVLYAIRALFATSSQAVTRDEFESFAKSLPDRHTAILNVSWVPRVTHEGRGTHEREGIRDGLPDYRIRTVASDGSLPVSSHRDEYFPKFYSTEPRTSHVYGLDLNDGGVRARTLNHIRDGNVLSSSPPLVLHIGTGDRRGLWAGLPVYARGLPHETTEDRHHNVLGIVQGVFQIDAMIDGILGGVKSPVRIYLFPPDAGPDDPPIHFASRQGAGAIAAKTQSELAAEVHQSFPLNFGDVQWKLVVTPEATVLTSAV